MTFAEAMAKSEDLKAAALFAIASRAPEAERKTALSAYIHFNPFMYLLAENQLVEHSENVGR